jgi:hypothetical protein
LASTDTVLPSSLLVLAEGGGEQTQQRLHLGGVDSGEGAIDSGEGAIDSGEGGVDGGEGAIDSGEGAIDGGSEKAPLPDPAAAVPCA